MVCKKGITYGSYSEAELPKLELTRKVVPALKKALHQSEELPSSDKTQPVLSCANSDAGWEYPEAYLLVIPSLFTSSFSLLATLGRHTIVVFTSLLPVSLLVAVLDQDLGKSITRQEKEMMRWLFGSGVLSVLVRNAEWAARVE